jgi:hypothetical protein
MPSRQERRKAERDAAKRAPAMAGAGGAAAARADLNVNPLGHWRTQTEDPYVGPGRRALLATHVIGCHLSQRRQTRRILTWRAMTAWPDPLAMLDALGLEVIQQRAAKGDGEAQFSLGWLLVRGADGQAGEQGTSGRSPRSDVGFALSNCLYRVVTGQGASMRSPDQMIYLRVPTLNIGGRGASGEGGGARARVRYGHAGYSLPLEEGT